LIVPETGATGSRSPQPAHNITANERNLKIFINAMIGAASADAADYSG
jgi:hypothetical protein